MATSREYLAFVLEQLTDLDGITYRLMMGEYIVYYHGKIAAYLCDNRFLVKPTPSALRLMPSAAWEAPYEGAKEMPVVEDVDDRAFLQTLFTAIEPELPERKGKKKENKKG